MLLLLNLIMPNLKEIFNMDSVLKLNMTCKIKQCQHCIQRGV